MKRDTTQPQKKLFKATANKFTTGIGNARNANGNNRIYLTRFRMRCFLRGVFLGDFVDEQEWQWDIRKEADHGMVAD